jgi:hypothetical protein
MMTDSFDTAATAVSVGLFLLYHVHLYFGVFKSSNKAAVSVMMHNANYWVKKNSDLADPASVTGSIQTFRNVNLVAVFISGYSLIAANGALETKSEDLQVRVRSLIFAICLFLSALAWAQVMRLASHMGYMVGIFSQLRLVESKKNNDETTPLGPLRPLGETFKIGTKTYTPVEKHFHNNTTMLKQLFLYFHLGIRFMVVSVPFAYYAVGPIALLIATTVVLLFLHIYDYSLNRNNLIGNMLFPAPDRASL